MSFLKITDPNERDKIVAELIQARKNIQQHSLIDRVGDIEMKREFGKIFSPITEKQEQLKEEIKTITPAIKALPIEYQQQETLTKAIEAAPMMTIGSTAKQYLEQYLSKTDADKTFGIHSFGNKLMIGDKEVKFDNDDIFIEGDKYEGTPGLWELITSKNPQNYLPEDKEKYANILRQTNALYQNNDPSNPRPKSSKAKKYNEIIKPIWYSFKGSGVKSNKTTIIPCNPDALVERFSLLMASKEAGNTGVRDEIISILDELKKQKIINNEQYKILSFKNAGN